MTTPTATPQRTEELLERRAFSAAELRIEPPRAGDDAGGIGRLLGHAAVFDVMSDDLGGFREIVERGAFADSIGPGGDDIRALFNHDPSLVLGRNRAGTLRLAEDARGLAIEVDLPDTSAGRDVAEWVRRGDVSQMSFGFNTIEDMWERQEGEQELRRLRKVRLFDVSPATFPAYPQTDLAVRSLEAWRAAAGCAAPERRERLARARRELALLGGGGGGDGSGGAAALFGGRGAVGAHRTPVAAADAGWARPALGDFTDDVWADLERDEQRRIVAHAAGYAGDWPETFDDIHLWHHRPARSGQGPLVPRGLFAAAGRFNQMQGVDAATRAGMARHLLAHYRQLELDPPEALVEAAE